MRYRFVERGSTVRKKLQAHNVSVSVRGDFVRIFPNVYNDAADVAVLTQVLGSF